MPLRNITKFCSAKCRASGVQCGSPASYGMATYRYHGARKPEIVRRGDEHPRYKSGGVRAASNGAKKGALGHGLALEQRSALQIFVLRARKP